MELFCIVETSQLTRFHRVSLAELCALLINTLKKVIGESVTLAIYKTEFYGTIGNRKKPLINVTRRSIIDVAGVLDKCLIKNLKMSKS